MYTNSSSTYCDIIFIIDDFVVELDDLIKHGLRALRDTLPSEVDLTTKVSRNM